MKEVKNNKRYTYKFRHVISLGSFCGVASELERIGLRGASAPFDWLISSFEDVITLIANGFDDFISTDLYFRDDQSNVVLSRRYNIEFYHDFKKDYIISEQLDIVKSKYDKRINSFMNNITEPVLFVRYILNVEECMYIENNIENILRLLKSYNELNDIIFIAHDNFITDRFHYYFVEKDKGDVVARRFITKNIELRRLLNSNYILNQELRNNNRKRYFKKQVMSIFRTNTTRVKRMLNGYYLHKIRLFPEWVLRKGQ